LQTGDFNQLIAHEVLSKAEQLIRIWKLRGFQPRAAALGGLLGAQKVCALPRVLWALGYLGKAA